MAVTISATFLLLHACRRSTTTGSHGTNDRPARRRSPKASYYGLKLSPARHAAGRPPVRTARRPRREGPGQEPGAERGRTGPRHPRHRRVPRRALRRAGQRAAPRPHGPTATSADPTTAPALWETPVAVHRPRRAVRDDRRLLDPAVDGRLLAGPGVEPDLRDHRLLRLGDRRHLVRATRVGGCGRAVRGRATGRSAASRSAVLAFGLWDGIPPQASARTPRSTATWNRDEAFVEAIEQQMPDRVRHLPAPGDAVPRGQAAREDARLRPVPRLPARRRLAALELRRDQGPARRRLAGAPPRPGRPGRRAARRCSGSGSPACGSTPTATPTAAREVAPDRRQRSESSRSAARTVASCSTTCARTSPPRPLRRRRSPLRPSGC